MAVPNQKRFLGWRSALREHEAIVIACLRALGIYATGTKAKKKKGKTYWKQGKSRAMYTITSSKVQWAVSILYIYEALSFFIEQWGILYVDLDGEWTFLMSLNCKRVWAQGLMDFVCLELFTWCFAWEGRPDHHFRWRLGKVLQVTLNANRTLNLCICQGIFVVNLDETY